jgi:hypothetical protein
MREELRIKQLDGVPASLAALRPKMFPLRSRIASFPVYLASIPDVKFTAAGAHREIEKGEYGILRFI